MAWIVKVKHPGGGLNVFGTADEDKLQSWVAKAKEKYPNSEVRVEEYDDPDDLAIKEQLELL